MLAAPVAPLVHGKQHTVRASALLNMHQVPMSSTLWGTIGICAESSTAIAFHARAAFNHMLQHPITCKHIGWNTFFQGMFICPQQATMGALRSSSNTKWAAMPLPLPAQVLGKASLSWHCPGHVSVIHGPSTTTSTQSSLHPKHLHPSPPHL